jgi:H+-translocating NAD(P) transhydrogenase subunit alpha
MSVVFIPEDRTPGERRVAATPASVRQLTEQGLEVRIGSGAGEAAGYPDHAYREAGAEIVADPASTWGEADLVLAVTAPPVDDVARLERGAVVVGFLASAADEVVRALAENEVTALAVELVPRISRAQAMDALSSQAMIAGYRAAIEAAHRLDKFFPLSMTAAGTIKPAVVVVLGAGVAGLQAIATAKRLGAVVRANDIREAAREEVESLGADFIDIEEAIDAEDAGGYAREVDEDFLTKQRRVLGDHLAEAHAVITTAFVPGRPAPLLVTEEMVERMQPGSVLIDMAAATGGNCALTDGSSEVEHGGVRIVGAPNLAATMPGEASKLYARNLVALTKLLLDPEDPGRLQLDTSDEIIEQAMLTHAGRVTHGPTAERVGAGDRTDEGPAPDATDQEAADVADREPAEGVDREAPEAAHRGTAGVDEEARS